MCDSTFATPYHQRCLEIPGIDVTIHSATKYIGGHSDVIAGACLGSAGLMQRVKALRTFLGNMAGPWTGWLLMRSLETLKVRMEKQATNAAKIAEFLEGHPAIERIYYLGSLPADDERNQEIFQRQCTSAGAMLSFDVKGGEKEAFRFLNNLKLIRLAVSLGSTESLAQHPASMTHAGVDPELRQELGITDKLVRLSVGVEHSDDLIDDLKRALTAIS